jgi:O-antigen ligase
MIEVVAKSEFFSPRPIAAKFSWASVSVQELLDILVLTLLATNGNIPILFPATGTSGSVNTGEGAFRFVYDGLILFFLFNFFYSSYRTKFAIRWHLTSVRILALFLVYAVGSLIWGVSPLTRIISDLLLLWGEFLFVNYLLEHYTMEKIGLLLGVCLTAVAVASILIAILLPAYGVDSTGNVGAWQGVFVQKNPLGTAMVLGLITAFSMPRDHRLLRAVLFFSSVIALIGSRSRESWIAAVACLGVFGLMRTILKFRSKERTAIFGLLMIVFVSLSIWAAMNADSLLEFLGRDRTLSGRTKIWLGVLLLIAKRPVEGYGVSSVTGTSIWSNVEAYAGWEFGAGSTHSIYLDLLLRFGVIGAVILSCGLIVSAWKAFRVLVADRQHRVEFPVLTLLAILVCGVAGHGLFQIPGLQLLLFFLAMIRLDILAGAIRKSPSARIP